MDFTLIKNIVAELAGLLSPARVSKIYQPNPDALVFKLRAGQETLRLLISAEVNQSRIHLTQMEWLNPNRPPRFCQLLRSRINRIDSLEIVNADRIVQFHCSGKQGPTRLVVELTGRFCNMILLNDQNVIIDLLKRVEGQGDRRTLMPGVDYIFPEKSAALAQSQENVDAVDRDELTWNQYVEKLYTEGRATGNKKDFPTQLQHTISKQVKKLTKRQKSITAELQKQENFAQDKQIGELILANLHQLSRGLETVSLLNYYLQPPENVSITLDPLLSPQANAEKYFKRYKKAKRGIEHSQRRLDETQAELDWLAQLEYQLQDSVKNSDIEEIAQELRDAGLLQEPNKLHSRRTQQPSKPHETTSPSGFRILWGRNNRQNDELSTRLLKAGDLWFHAHNAPGAHVVMKCGERGSQILDEDIRYAASIAAGYSKLKTDTKVEVISAEAKSVRKPKGSRSGLVTVQQYKTLVVQPLRVET
ncbi:MAG: NFACT family protein [Deltaproteobacteria bacterium]|nr:NFACT family protein [Deltaproteobacteria bacterium]